MNRLPLTDQEARDLGRITVRIAMWLTVAALVLMGLSLVLGLSAANASEREPVADTVSQAAAGEPASLSGGLYQGKTARWWARRAVQAREDANKRGRTIRRLKRVVAAKFIPPYWVAVASCESGVDWGYNGPSGFDGAVQFHPGTWSAYRLPSYPRYAWQASPFQQLVIAELVLAAEGWRAWPACSRKLGLR